MAVLRVGIVWALLLPSLLLLLSGSRVHGEDAGAR
jgi:hypothetical protein